MGKSKCVSLAEVQAIVRLVGECRELGDDPVVWRQHFCAGLARMVGADLSMSGEMAGIVRGPIRMAGGTAWGFENGFNLAGYQAMGVGNPLQSETFRALVRRVQTDAPTGVTAARQQLLSEREWQQSFDYHSLAKVLGTDALLSSLVASNRLRDEFDAISFSRPPGERRFDDYEVALVQLAHQEVARLVGGPLARFDEPAPSKLPPRVRDVLACLLEGDGDKQVASRLRLSQHTVNQYTKQIYRYFGVGGRAELLARWVRRGWGSRSDWAVVASAPRI
jgi:DNA-binding CsgD family transcriptional regulator